MIKCAFASRAVVAAIALVPAAIILTPPAIGNAQPSNGVDDVPGMHYGVTAGQPCTNTLRYIYGRDINGNVVVCHIGSDGRTAFWDGPITGFYGVQQSGAPCPSSGQAAAQAPDGRGLLCDPTFGWE